MFQEVVSFAVWLKTVHRKWEFIPEKSKPTNTGNMFIRNSELTKVSRPENHPHGQLTYQCPHTCT